MRKFLFITGIFILCVEVVLFFHIPYKPSQIFHRPYWQFMSIDTMKYSRDLSREKLQDQSFNTVIDTQVQNIAKTGATHVAIATPYDEEFVPILTRWVQAARKYKLHVWFRGNFSGWEKWFDYPEISRDEHIAKTQLFILSHADLFVDGDVFSACPECENGGPGDPRRTGDITGHRNFLIAEYAVTKSAFKQVNKKVTSNYNSMNGDVARAIMDKETTSKLDGIVVIDHYVATPEQLTNDIREIANQAQGKVVLGEFGAPIPDINGDMTEAEQAAWLESALRKLITNKNLIGVNYWVNVGGSTALWNDTGLPKKAVNTITKYFSHR